MVESSWESPQEPLSIRSDLGDYSPEPSDRGGRDPQETLVPVPRPRRWWNCAANIDMNVQMKESRHRLASVSSCFLLMRQDRLSSPPVQSAAALLNF